MNTRMLRHALNPMERIQILMHRNLENGCAALAAGDNRIREEEHPDPVPPLAILGKDFFLVGDPILVPLVDGCRVVHAEDVNVFDLKASAFQLGRGVVSLREKEHNRKTNLVDDPTKGAGGIGTGENVLVHEETPDEVLELPWGTDAGDLEDKNAIVIEEIIDLAEELGVAADTDVLQRRQDTGGNDPSGH